MALMFIIYGAKGVPYMLWVDTINGNINRYVDRYFMPTLRQIPRRYWSWHKQDKVMRIYNSLIDFRSADRPENMEGFGYDYIHINEAGIALKDRSLYENTIVPMMFDFPKSKLIAAGVPKGKRAKGEKHMFFELSERAVGNDPRFVDRYKQLTITSYDNPRNKPEDLAKMEADLDPLTVRQEMYGEFIDKTGMLVMYCFTDAHKADVKINPELPIFLSFDFNLNPFVCLIAQEGVHENGLKYIHFIDEIYLTRDQQTTDMTYIEKICSRIKIRYGGMTLRVTGDASSKHGELALEVHKSAWTEVMRFLNIGEPTLPGRNPGIAKSIEQCNAMLSHPERIEIRVNPNACPELINDFETVKILEDGTIDKEGQKMRSHLLDAFRYHMNTWHYDFIEYL